MTKLQLLCNELNPRAQELCKVIASDTEATNEVLRAARLISSNHIDSLPNAFIVLGVNTVKNIARMVSGREEMKESAL